MTEISDASASYHIKYTIMLCTIVPYILSSCTEHADNKLRSVLISRIVELYLYYALATILETGAQHTAVKRIDIYGKL